MYDTAKALGCLCDDCPLRTEGIGPIVPNSIKRRRPAILTVVGEHPGPKEIEKGYFFAGRSGEFIEKVWLRCRINASNIHYTNATLCDQEKPLPAKEWRKAVECCRPRLIRELKAVKSKQLLGYGNWALWALTGKSKISNWMGANLPVISELAETTHAKHTVCTFQPAHVLRPDGRAYIAVCRIHTARAYYLADGRLKPWKWPKIITEPSKEAVAALKKIAKSRQPVGLDLEDYGDATDPTIMAIGVANTKVAVSIPCHGYYAKGREWVQPIEKWKYGKQCFDIIKRIVEDPKIPKVYQHGQHDILGFEALGWKPAAYDFDTLIAHTILAPMMRHKLSLIACIEFHADRWKDEFIAGTDAKGAEAFVKRRSVELRIYNAKDAYMTVLLLGPLQQRLRDFHNGPEIFGSYMRRARIATAMRRRGVLVDTTKFARHRKILGQRRGRARRELQRIAAEFGLHKSFRRRRKNESKEKYRERRRAHNRSTAVFNPNAHAHNNKLFFDKLGIRVRKYGKSGAPSLDQKYLTDLVGHPNILVQTCARALLRYRRYSKLRQTYVGRKMIALIDKYGIVHPSWNVSGAKTQRWSGSDPNLMNVPTPKIVRGKVVAPGLRDIFIAHDGGWILASDYSQLELRILALLANDPKLLAWYAEGIDVHKQNARELFGREWEKATDKNRENMRDLAKRFVYALNYGGSARTVWTSLVVDFPQLTIDSVERLMQRWYALHPQIRDWQNRVLREARQNRYVEIPIAGLRLYFNGPPEATKVYNYPIQGLAAWIINQAIERVDEAAPDSLIMQVHDELILSVPDRNPDIEKAVHVLWKEMPQKVTIEGRTMTMPVDLKIGKDYGRCEKFADAAQLRKVCRTARAVNATTT